MGQVSCPHYPPTILGYPTFICRGCASLVADPRHPQNQANGISKAETLADPGTRTLPKSPYRRG
jgi:hypothetical protein